MYIKLKQFAFVISKITSGFFTAQIRAQLSFWIEGYIAQVTSSLPFFAISKGKLWKNRKQRGMKRLGKSASRDVSRHNVRDWLDERRGEGGDNFLQNSPLESFIVSRQAWFFSLLLPLWVRDASNSFMYNQEMFFSRLNFRQFASNPQSKSPSEDRRDY